MNADWHGGRSIGGHRHTVDGDFTVASPTGVAKISYPFEGDSYSPQFLPELIGLFIYDFVKDSYGFDPINPDPYAGQANKYWACFLLEQEFTVAADWYSQLDLNTPYDSANYWPDYAGARPINHAILVSESPQEDAGNGLVKFTRTYCYMSHVTDGHFSEIKWDFGFFGRNSYETINYTFPAISGSTYLQNQNPLPGQIGNYVPMDGRFSPLSVEVTARVCDEFFLFNFDPNVELTPQFGNPTERLYSIPAFRVFVKNFSNETNVITSFDELNAAGYIETKDGKTVDGVVFTREQGSVPPKYPTGPTNGRNGIAEIGYTTPAELPSAFKIIGCEICAKASTWQRWRGNIWKRTTYFVTAQ